MSAKSDGLQEALGSMKAKKSGERMVRTICSLCGPLPGCGLNCYVNDGRLMRVEGMKEAQNKVTQKLDEIEKIKQETYVPEVKIEAAIPIKREKALEPLTETELMVLETIGKEGEKTSPAIREKIGLTREHTARLMKKLYKDGYLERDTHKMPYVYRLKEEMQKILERREAKAS